MYSPPAASTSNSQDESRRQELPWTEQFNSGNPTAISHGNHMQEANFHTHILTSRHVSQATGFQQHQLKRKAHHLSEHITTQGQEQDSRPTSLRNPTSETLVTTIVTPTTIRPIQLPVVTKTPIPDVNTNPILILMTPEGLDINSFLIPSGDLLPYTTSGKFNITAQMLISPNHTVPLPMPPQLGIQVSAQHNPFLTAEADRYGLPRGRLASHPSVLTAELADPQLLPATSKCPGPYLSLFPPRIRRPESSAHYKMFYPAQAALYQQIIAHNCPNYMGAKELVGHQFQLDIWKELLQGHPDQ